MTDINPANPQMSDQEVIRYINRRLREEKIGVKEVYSALSGDNPYIDITTRKSRQGKNYINIITQPISPTDDELKKWGQRLGPTLLRTTLPSTFMKNEFEVTVYHPTSEDEIGSLVLSATLVDSLVREVGTPDVSPYSGRLTIGDPLEKVLNVTFEAYRSRYVPLPTPQPAGF